MNKKKNSKARGIEPGMVIDALLRPCMPFHQTSKLLCPVALATGQSNLHGVEPWISALLPLC